MVRSPVAIGSALAVFAVCCAQPRFATATQPNANFIELAHVDPYGVYNDCVGYVDSLTGNEYALIGTDLGTSIWNITDPFNPYETGFVPSSGAVPNRWRDIDTYSNNAYVVTEGDTSGMQVIELADPEAPTHLLRRHIHTAHTLWVDRSVPRVYNMGVDLSMGFRSYRLENPDVPSGLVTWNAPYYHDLWSGGGVAYAAAILDGGRFDILDVSDPFAPTLVSTTVYPNGKTHNMWPSDDGNYLFTTDEIPGAGTVRVWDVSVPTNCIQVAAFPVYTNTSAHNVTVKNDTAWCSWYEEGVLVFDVTDPFDPIQIGSFDTGPDTTLPFPSNFAGCWSVYPFLPSGVVVTSDILQGMHLIYYADEVGVVSGQVTDFVLGQPIAGVEVAIPDFFNRRVTTDSLGNYSAVLPGGVHAAIASAEGYISDSSGTVSIADGDTTDLDFALVPTSATGVGSSLGPVASTLRAPSPNPSRGQTRIAFELDRPGPVTLAVFDASGRRVRTLLSGALPAGPHALVWDGRDDVGRAAASGSFFVRLDAADQQRTRKLAIVR
jgi:choice-of-anchor B domain-containing protein